MSHKNETNFEFFAYKLFGPIVILLGILGNSFGIIVLKRKEMNKLGPKNTYKYLFVIDIICLPLILNNYMIHAYGFGFSNFSRLACKIYMHYAYLFSSISPFILVYILIERYLAIKFPVESNFLRSKKSQFVYISVILILNFFYFLYIPFISDIKYEKAVNASTKNLTLCKIVRSKEVSSVFVFFARIFLPFCLIVIFSILLISKIFNSRSNISKNYTERKKKIFRKDVHLSILAVVSNFLIISLNFPLFIIFFIFKNDKNVWFVFALHIYHLSYVFQFYFFIFANKMFRKAFYSFLKRSNENENRNNELKAEMIEMIAN